ncbi:hypothetical protein L596_021714 [Steinernema carpocapsae]|uniref:Uncharacterized protein n=1 Tax=Steinernema carpocapsae TaxID=34508 RepID=A0A4U5MJM0_STECR|nr:hypothetical protein L596_021714 [Steinernema carpocapsae]
MSFFRCTECTDTIFTVCCRTTTESSRVEILKEKQKREAKMENQQWKKPSKVDQEENRNDIKVEKFQTPRKSKEEKEKTIKKQTKRLKLWKKMKLLPQAVFAKFRSFK